MRWYRKAADAGSHVGMKAIAEMYDEGIGVARDHDEAMRWFRKAADTGDQEAVEYLKQHP
jgi:uncharacterized protein